MSKDSTTSEANASASPTQARVRWTRAEITLMIGAITLIFLSAFEGLATTTIMPLIVEELKAESWFSVASGASQASSVFAVVIAGALADWRGVRLILMSGVASFAIGLLLCALAPHISFFVLGRLMQGFGSGLVVVPLYMMIAAIASEEHRPTYFAAFSLAWTMPALIGPAIAGWVANVFGWRWVFGAVPAFSIIAVFLFVPLLRMMPAERSEFPEKLRTLGGMALVAACGVLILQLSGAVSGEQTAHNGGAKLVLMSLIGIFLTFLYLPRLLPNGLFRFKAGLSSLLGSRLFALATMAGTQAFVPFVMQRVHGWSATWSAIAVTFGAISWSIGAIIQARMTDPQLQRRFPLIGSIFLFLGSLGAVTLIFPFISPWIGIGFTMLIALGVGLLHSTISALALNVAPPHKHGKVSSWLQVADTGGTALQMAIISVLLAVWSFIPGIEGTYWQYLPAMLMGVVAGLLTIISARRSLAE